MLAVVVGTFGASEACSDAVFATEFATFSDAELAVLACVVVRALLLGFDTLFSFGILKLLSTPASPFWFYRVSLMPMRLIVIG